VNQLRKNRIKPTTSKPHRVPKDFIINRWYKSSTLVLQYAKCIIKRTKLYNGTCWENLLGTNGWNWIFPLFWTPTVPQRHCLLKEVSLLLYFHSYSVIILRWLYTHGKTLIDTWHPLTNNIMLIHLVQLANLWMDWFL